MHEIQADMRLSEQDDVYAYGQVMIDRCIKFPVQMRRYIDNESGEGGKGCCIHGISG